MPRCRRINAQSTSGRRWARPAERHLLQTANHLIALYLENGAVLEAERHHLALVAPRLAARTGSDRDPDVAEALANLGSIHYGNRRYLEARTAYEAALAIRERVSTEPSSGLATLLNNLALALLNTGEIERAMGHSQRSLAMIEATAGPMSQLLIIALVNGAGEELQMAARPGGSGAFLDRALSIAHRTVGDEHPITATVLSRYAVFLKETHRKKEAAQLEDRVRQMRVRPLEPDPRQTVDVRELSSMK